MGRLNETISFALFNVRLTANEVNSNTRSRDFLSLDY